MIRRPPRSTQSRSSAASDVYKRQGLLLDLASNFVTVLARLTHGVVTSGSAVLGVFGVSWTLLTAVGRAAVVVTTTGAAPMLIVANLLVASAAFFGLTRLLAPVSYTHLTLPTIYS